MKSYKSIRHQTSLKVGSSKGRPRVWIEGKYLIKAGFEAGTSFEAYEGKESIRLVLSRHDGPTNRHVSSRKNRQSPIIDYSIPITCELSNAEKVCVAIYKNSIVLRKERIDLRISERRNNRKSVSLYAGGGLLTEAAKQAGFNCVAANEIDSGYAEIFAKNHPTTTIHSCSIEQVDFSALKASVGPIGLLDLGMPCEPFSTARRSSKGKNEEHPEAHEHGDLVFWTLNAIDKLNPHTTLIEEVPNFLKSASFQILKRTLIRMGYNVDARIFDSSEYSMATSRKRAVVCATTFKSVKWPEPTGSQDLPPLLNATDHEDNQWFTRESKNWLYKHWDKQTAKGNGFASSVITPDTRTIGTIKKRYFSQQGDNPVVKHPSHKDKHRWLTISEVKRITGLPENYDLGEFKTRAGEIMGQGVPVKTFATIIRSIFSTLP